MGRWRALGTLMNVIPTTRPCFGGDLLKVSMETISASTGRGQSSRFRQTRDPNIPNQQ